MDKQVFARFEFKMRFGYHILQQSHVSALHSANVFENVVWKMSSILSRPRCVKCVWYKRYLIRLCWSKTTLFNMVDEILRNLAVFRELRYVSVISVPQPCITVAAPAWSRPGFQYDLHPNGTWKRLNEAQKCQIISVVAKPIWPPIAVNVLSTI